MKSLRLVVAGVILLPLIAGAVVSSGSGISYPAGSVSWVSPPQAGNGWYWMYDDAEPGPPFDDPPIPAMLIEPYENYAIHDSLYANKLSPYNDQPFQYVLPDSFWYFGFWAEPGDFLYISPDGWVSFDFAGSSGAPTPPATVPPFPDDASPNAIIAPLWADYDPTRTPGDGKENRIYTYYDGNRGALVVEWYRVQGQSTGNEYSFLLILYLGGQSRLVEESSCGVIYSGHLMEFLYNTASAGWDADNAATGFEDPDGEQGITYQGIIDTNGDDFHAVRAGYRRIFKNDVRSDLILSPGSMMLRYTPVETRVVVANAGQETEHFVANVTIEDVAAHEIVYEFNLGSFNLGPGEKDTVIGPCFTPGDLGVEYLVKSVVMLDRDSCRGNDTLEMTAFVACDDTVCVMDHIEDTLYINIYQSYLYPAVFFEADKGMFVSGGRIYTPRMYIPAYPLQRQGPFAGAVWQAEGGCGLPSGPPLAMAPCEADTPWTSFAFHENGAVFVPAGEPGNFWFGAVPTSSADPVAFGTGWTKIPTLSVCYQGSGPRSITYLFSDWQWFAFSEYYIELFNHLGFGDYPFSPKPALPCYEEEPHDLTVHHFQSPSRSYVEAGVAVTPEVGVANIGHQAEPTTGLFPVRMLVVDSETADTVFDEASLVSHIGCAYDAADDPDTLYVALPPWTPEGLCSRNSSTRTYELIGIVRLGVVGPDSTDHCPYNDTLRRTVECLWSHDVGADSMLLLPLPDRPPDWYDPGIPITTHAWIANYGYNEEHNFDVRLEVIDVDSNVLRWHNLQEVEVLDWRGNTLERPYITEVVFLPYTTPDERHMTFEVRTELVGDMCPENDYWVEHINSGIEEEPSNLPLSLSVINPNPFAGLAEISYSLPCASYVSLKVFDVSGTLVTDLVNDNRQAGRHTIPWDVTNTSGCRVSAGVYLVRLEVDGQKLVRKLVVID